MGSGTTLVEAKLLSRHAVGVDINPQSVSISETNLQFQCETISKIFTRNGNATDLHFIKDSRIDFICTHPPYANIIKYSKGIEGDISLLGVEAFLNEMKKVANEAYRVLKKGKMCAVMIGDVRKYGKVIPLGFRMMECFLQAGFTNKEIIIKEITDVVINGNTYYYISDTTDNRYRISIQNSNQLPFIKNGDKINIGYQKESNLTEIKDIK